MQALQDALFISASSIFIPLAVMITSFLIVILTTILAAIPIVADFALVVGALFLPLAVAVYPFVPAWSVRAFETMISAAMQSVAAAFLLQILLADNGPLAAGLAAGAAQMQMSNGQFFPFLNALQGIVLMCLLAIIVAVKLPNVVSSIFGGGAINGAEIAAGAIKKAATTVAGAGVGAAVGGAAAKAAGGSVIGGIVKGAAKGATAGSGTAKAISIALGGIKGGKPK